MIKVDIFSGFLGAGKTTLIKKLIKEAYNGEKVVIQLETLLNKMKKIEQDVLKEYSKI